METKAEYQIWDTIVNSAKTKFDYKHIRAMFKKQGALLSEDFDLLVLKGGKLQANEGLYFNYKVFNEKDSSRLNRYIATQQKYLALDLMENDFVMDEFDHPEMKAYMRSFNEESGDYRKDD